MQDTALSINKIGHAMHDLDPVFESFSYTPQLADVAADIGLGDPLALQSMYIFKQPRIGGEVGCHQDAPFLYTDPITVTGFWFAIEDATLDNGCLWAQPGGHRGPLRRVYQRVDTDDPDGGDGATRFVELDDTPLPDPPDGLVPIVAPAGTMVILHGLLPHWSDVNRSPTSRHTRTASTASARPPTTRRGTGCSGHRRCRCAVSTGLLRAARTRCGARPARTPRSPPDGLFCVTAQVPGDLCG